MRNGNSCLPICALPKCSKRATVKTCRAPSDNRELKPSTRQWGPRGSGRFPRSSIELDFIEHRRGAGDLVALRPQERRLLELLQQNANRLVKHKVLVRKLYGNVSPDSGRLRLRR